MEIKKESVAKTGCSCNFCDRGVYEGNTVTFPYKDLYIIGRQGGGLTISICQQCLDELSPFIAPPDNIPAPKTTPVPDGYEQELIPRINSMFLEKQAFIEKTVREFNSSPISSKQSPDKLKDYAEWAWLATMLCRFQIQLENINQRVTDNHNNTARHSSFIDLNTPLR